MHDVFERIFFNASLLAMIAYVLTKLSPVKKLIVNASSTHSLRLKLFMAVLFGTIGIMSTYLGFPIQGAIANTRAIGVLVGGLLGGPVVGIVSGLIAGGHRILIDIGGFTALACGLSTVLEGLIGGLLSREFKRRHSPWGFAMMVAVGAEILQMSIILLLACPFDQAWHLVKIISLPMILINAFGTIIFVSILDSIFMEQDQESAKRIRLILDVADQCLPYLSKGLDNKESINQAAHIIKKAISVDGVLFSSKTEIVAHAGKLPSSLRQFPGWTPQVIERTINTSHAQRVGDPFQDGIFNELLRDKAVLSAPLTFKDGEIVGTFTLLVPKYKLTLQVEEDIVTGLAKVFSTQLELYRIEQQKKLLKYAEFSLLQSQINPHFLFNALSTITALIREKPERARELLVILSQYFRNTLNNKEYMISIYEELEHVNAYLELEKARFEDRLEIIQTVPEGLDYMVPSFILQPIVENAVKHGANKHPFKGVVKIQIVEKNNEVEIQVRDNGYGIPPEVVTGLGEKNLEGNSLGMQNVHQRLTNIYGEKYGLQVDHKSNETLVSMRIPQTGRESYHEAIGY